MWMFSYVRFRKRYKENEMLCEFTRQPYNVNPLNPITAIEYGSALMQCQQYKSAMHVFEGVKDRYANYKDIFPFLDTNISFCKKPLPWSSGAKDHKGGSWWHNFLLVRFGGKRQVVISEDTRLAFNSMLRMMRRN